MSMYIPMPDSEIPRTQCIAGRLTTVLRANIIREKKRQINNKKRIKYKIIQKSIKTLLHHANENYHGVHIKSLSFHHKIKSVTERKKKLV